MTTRERHRRDTEIVAASHAGVPARVIAARFDLSKRTCNRIIRAQRQEIRQTLSRSFAPAKSPASALELLGAMEELYLHASQEARVGKRAQVAIAFGLERLFWDGHRAALEKLIAEASWEESSLNDASS
jgi:hypothetical protein